MIIDWTMRSSFQRGRVSTVTVPCFFRRKNPDFKIRNIIFIFSVTACDRHGAIVPYYLGWTLVLRDEWYQHTKGVIDVSWYRRKPISNCWASTWGLTFENTEAQTSDQQKPVAGNNTWKCSKYIFHICDTLLLWNEAGAASPHYTLS